MPSKIYAFSIVRSSGCQVWRLQRESELNASPEPEAGPIAGIAGEALQGLKNRQHAAGPQAIAKAKWALRVAAANTHGLVYVIRSANALLRYRAGDVHY